MQFEQVMLPFLDAAYNLARWLTQDEHERRTALVQEAYLLGRAVFRQLSRWRRPGVAPGHSPPGVVRLVDQMAVKAGMTYDEDLHDQGDEASDPAVLAMREFDQARVRQAVEELAPQLREVIVLRELEGSELQQIAAIAEVPVGTVMSRLSRGRQQLQRRLAEGEKQ